MFYDDLGTLSNLVCHVIAFQITIEGHVKCFIPVTDYYHNKVMCRWIPHFMQEHTPILTEGIIVAFSIITEQLQASEGIHL